MLLLSITGEEKLAESSTISSYDSHPSTLFQTNVGLLSDKRELSAGEMRVGASILSSGAAGLLEFFLVHRISKQIEMNI